MTLVEVLIGLAVGSIVIGASFFVITQFSKQYQLSSDYIEISQNARYSLFLMKRDIRMAGHKDPESPFGNISSPLSIESTGDDCCDKITLIYDKDKATRLKIIYEVTNYLNGKQLVKSESQCEVNGICSGQKGDWETISTKEPVSRNVSNLQFDSAITGKDYLYLLDSGYRTMGIFSKTTGEPVVDFPVINSDGHRGFLLDKGRMSNYYLMDEKLKISMPNRNVQIQISLEKNYINKKIEETFYSSATVRNF